MLTNNVSKRSKGYNRSELNESELQNVSSSVTSPLDTVPTAEKEVEEETSFF